MPSKIATGLAQTRPLYRVKGIRGCQVGWVIWTTDSRVVVMDLYETRTGRILQCVVVPESRVVGYAYADKEVSRQARAAYAHWLDECDGDEGKEGMRGALAW